MSKTNSISEEDNAAYNYLTKLASSFYRECTKPRVFVGAQDNTVWGFKQFRACITGFSGDHAKEAILIMPQVGDSREAAILKVIDSLEKMAHEKIVNMESHE